MKIIFVNITNDQNVIEFVKTKSMISNTLPFRYITYLEYGIPVYNLFPKKEILYLLREAVNGDSNTLDFDKAYYTQIFTNPNSFLDFMKIMNVIESQDYTFILTRYDDDYYISITDALIKMIQLRYSLSSYLIQNSEDIDESDFKDLQFTTIEGHKNYINDIEKFSLMTGNFSIKEKEIDIERDLDLIDQLMEENIITELPILK